MVSGRGDAVNTHDILTGSDPQGLFSTAGGDTTCGNWTKSGEGSAIVGHHDRAGLQNTRHMNSWNRSEEHTSELQSHSDLVCRLLLEKKKKKNIKQNNNTKYTKQ